MKPIDSKMLQRMALVWIVTQVMFLLPRNGFKLAFGSLIHQPAFVFGMPLLLACLSIFIPAKNIADDETFETYQTSRSRSRSLNWLNLVMGIVFLGLVTIMGIAANNGWTPGGGRSIVKMNIGLLFFLAIPLLMMVFSVKRLREPD